MCGPHSNMFSQNRYLSGYSCIDGLDMFLKLKVKSFVTRLTFFSILNRNIQG